MYISSEGLCGFSETDTYPIGVFHIPSVTLSSALGQDTFLKNYQRK